MIVDTNWVKTFFNSAMMLNNCYNSSTQSFHEQNIIVGSDSSYERIKCNKKADSAEIGVHILNCIFFQISVKNEITAIISRIKLFYRYPYFMQS